MTTQRTLRSNTRMGLSNDDKELIRSLIQPLDQKLDNINEQLVKRITDLELVVEEQSTCMKTQADAITALDARVSKLEDINAVNRAAIDTIRAATNSTEQYTRRESVRVSGLPNPAQAKRKSCARLKTAILQ